MMGVASFSPSELFRAMAPIELVLKSFQSYCCKETEDTLDECNSDQSYWVNEDAQERFALLLRSILKPVCIGCDESIEFSPTDRYIRKVLSKFVAKVEENSCMIESDEFVELMMKYQMKPGTKNDSLPDPNECCYVSFELPILNNSNITRNIHRPANDVVGIKIFPYHNDVGVRKIWEAGAALAEFFLVRPDLIKDKSVLELGAGVGLTGIVISGLCEPNRVHLTDYTDATLINMEHNISVNKHWIQNARGRDCPVTSGHLEWEEYADNMNDDESSNEICAKVSSIHQPDPLSRSLARTSDVLIAADAVYDRSVIPPLISVVRQHLNDPSKVAIFATTFRNATTFALFEKEIQSKGITVKSASSDDLNKMPFIFPCYISQPRSDVRITFMTVDT